MIIIYAHPNKDGHSGEYLRQVLELCKQKNIDPVVWDLYEMNYDPILAPSEHYTSGHKDVSDLNQEIQQKIKAEDKFVFIYPVWWNNMPAILKGFMDRVFVAGYAYRYQHGIPRKLLKGRAVVLTSSGGPNIFFRFIAGRRAHKVLTRDILWFCGIGSRSYNLGGASRFNDAHKSSIGRKIKQGFRYLGI